jgi:2-polyprenyl-3-methyl-5-hydroxy-6-metoxy-1,4-benzoquinol methylase
MSTINDIRPFSCLAKVDRVYSNQGNSPLLDLLSKDCRRVLDIGCGAGDNAALIKARNPDCDVFGITHSEEEALLTKVRMKKCWVADIEVELPEDLANQSFDVLAFSHVLEHLRDPAAALERYSRLLTRGGQVLIAVPNILSWAMRLQFLRGDFEYKSCGPLDDTHLRFFTYLTADKYCYRDPPTSW